MYSEIKSTVGDLKKKLEEFSDDAEFEIYCNDNHDMWFSVIEIVKEEQIGIAKVITHKPPIVLYKG